ncbi:390_t:CDS:2 [Cetraspora pellucida]|uniref:390_t:CDS:1 n=1 Tax=Cetraspora pellucida TaxID=1433469 RepID=A0ACA9M8Y3_9GLOM|nr:390_t:CDS:2 [Cetraspora pellucida]
MPSRKNIARRACVTNKSCRSWSVKEKLMVIFYLERINSVRATTKRFEIEPKQVCEWRNKKQELLNAASYALTLNCGRQAHNENTEEVLTFDNIDGDEYEVEVDNVWE